MEEVFTAVKRSSEKYQFAFMHSQLSSEESSVEGNELEGNLDANDPS